MCWQTVFLYIRTVIMEAAPEILYQDNHLLAVAKPAGWLVQGDATGDSTLSDWVKDYIKEKYKKPGLVYLGVLHRLDRPVSGIVLFARTSKAAERMSRLFQQHAIEKRYVAMVKGMPAQPEAVLENYLLRNEKNNTTRAFVRPVDGAQYARLDYTVLKKYPAHSLLEINLHTGRHHQIRSQLAFIGCPIKGDVKYGYSTPNPDGSIDLHARLLRFKHPVTQAEITIESNPPFAV